MKMKYLIGWLKNFFSRHIICKMSDGYHTFEELYAHRNNLFCTLLILHPKQSWRSLRDADGQYSPGYFVAGMSLPTGEISYHLPISFWNWLGGIPILERAMYDGYSWWAYDDFLK